MIAIKGMEMPKSCSECSFKASDYVCGLLDCVFSCNHFKERNYNCPLVEIDESKLEVILELWAENQDLEKKLEEIKRVVKAPMGGKHEKYNKIVEILERC